MPILALVRDLIFSTKIAATAKATGQPIRLIRDPAKLAVEPAGLLLLDLNLEGGIAAASLWKLSTGGQIVGFVSHVDAETAAAAREAGIDRVLARSRFVELLPELLTSATLS